MANSNSIKIQLTDVNPNEVFLFNSIRDAAIGFAVIEGKSVHTVRGLLLRRVKKIAYS